MKNLVIGLLIVAIIGGAGRYIYMQNNTISETSTDTNVTITPVIPTPTPSVVETPNPTVSGDITMEISNMQFAQPALEVKRGTKVTWTNKDTAPHDVTSQDTGPLASARLATGDSFSYTFTDVGVFNYYCTLHPMMKATVTVVE